MPPYMQSTSNPFGISGGGNPYAPGGPLYGQGANMGGRVIPSQPVQGQPTAWGIVQQTGGQGMQMAGSPVLAPQPGAMPMPMLPQATSLAELLAAVPSYQPVGGYGAQQWQLPAYAAPAASGAVTGAQGVPQTAPSPVAPNIQTGITVPQPTGPAAAPQQPAAAPWMARSPKAMSGGSAAYGQAIQPMAGQLASDYYSQLAPLMLGAQQAQSQAGLGWGGLYNLLQQQQAQDTAQRQRDLFSAFRGLA